jgi:hypothetical protein
MYFLRSVKNLSEKSLKALYYSLVHCHLIYGVQVWSCVNQSLLKGIEKKQKDAIRIISLASYNAHTEPLFKKLNILPLKQLIDYFKIQFIHQFKFKHLPSAFENVWTLNADRYIENEYMLLRNINEFFVPFKSSRKTSAGSISEAVE